MSKRDGGGNTGGTLAASQTAFERKGAGVGDETANLSGVGTDELTVREKAMQRLAEGKDWKTQVSETRVPGKLDKSKFWSGVENKVDSGVGSSSESEDESSQTRGAKISHAVSLQRFSDAEKSRAAAEDTREAERDGAEKAANDAMSVGNAALVKMRAEKSAKAEDQKKAAQAAVEEQIRVAAAEQVRVAEAQVAQQRATEQAAREVAQVAAVQAEQRDAEAQRVSQVLAEREARAAQAKTTEEAALAQKEAETKNVIEIAQEAAAEGVATDAKVEAAEIAAQEEEIVQAVETFTPVIARAMAEALSTAQSRTDSANKGGLPVPRANPESTDKKGRETRRQQCAEDQEQISGVADTFQASEPAKPSVFQRRVDVRGDLPKPRTVQGNKIVNEGVSTTRMIAGAENARIAAEATVRRVLTAGVGVVKVGAEREREAAAQEAAAKIVVGRERLAALVDQAEIERAAEAAAALITPLTTARSKEEQAAINATRVGRSPSTPTFTASSDRGFVSSTGVTRSSGTESGGVFPSSVGGVGRPKVDSSKFEKLIIASAAEQATEAERRDQAAQRADEARMAKLGRAAKVTDANVMSGALASVVGREQARNDDTALDSTLASEIGVLTANNDKLAEVLAGLKGRGGESESSASTSTTVPATVGKLNTSAFSGSSRITDEQARRAAESALNSDGRSRVVVAKRLDNWVNRGDAVTAAAGASDPMGDISREIEAGKQKTAEDLKRQREEEMQDGKPSTARGGAERGDVAARKVEIEVISSGKGASRTTTGTGIGAEKFAAKKAMLESFLQAKSGEKENPAVGKLVLSEFAEFDTLLGGGKSGHGTGAEGVGVGKFDMNAWNILVEENRSKHTPNEFKKPYDEIDIKKSGEDLSGTLPGGALTGGSRSWSKPTPVPVVVAPPIAVSPPVSTVVTTPVVVTNANANANTPKDLSELIEATAKTMFGGNTEKNNSPNDKFLRNTVELQNEGNTRSVVKSLSKIFGGTEDGAKVAFNYLADAKIMIEFAKKYATSIDDNDIEFEKEGLTPKSQAEEAYQYVANKSGVNKEDLKGIEQKFNKNLNGLVENRKSDANSISFNFESYGDKVKDPSSTVYHPKIEGNFVNGGVAAPSEGR